jgi:ornithine cyclodeaminase
MPTVRIIGQADVPALLPMAECVELMSEALRRLAEGDAVQPLRSVVRLPGRAGLLATMPAYLGSPPTVGVKVITVFLANHGTPLDSHQGAVLLFDAENGSLVAVIDATSITGIRTAAVSAAATDALARPQAATLAVLGSGVQASAHIAAMRVVRPIALVLVWSRDPGRARAFADRESARHRIPIQAASTAREAIQGAAIVCAATSAATPVLHGEWLAPGSHVNAAGACVPTSRELDTPAVVRSRLFVDRRESALSEAGDIVIPIREGAIGPDHIVAEIGDVLVGRAEGRRSAEEITLFKSLGLAIEDLAAARHVYARAVEAGVGAKVELGGARLDPA